MDISGIEFKFDDFFWMGSVDLPSWHGYRSFNESSELLSSDYPLMLRYEECETPPVPSRFSETIDWLINNAEYLHNQILEKILQEFGNESRMCGYSAKLDGLKTLNNATDIKQFVIPNIVYIHEANNGSVGKIGIRFSCRWDTDHELGLVIVDGEVSAFGYGSRAFEG
ncbi:hypothetical protein [Reinekea sp. G2M2-21]|uniref:DUF6985 domain-containing protein n=1 Tax=Reinekea sp. G2M2-21 TaxID=2788942 RepID=UPI0018AB9F43|nr:hypothetical protein [Reinekea sp. G2M2-21]